MKRRTLIISSAAVMLPLPSIAAARKSQKIQDSIIVHVDCHNDVLPPYFDVKFSDGTGERYTSVEDRLSVIQKIQKQISW